MAILLKTILEDYSGYGVQGQLYDLGKDFSNFHRTIDGADDQITRKFEQSIAGNLI